MSSQFKSVLSGVVILSLVIFLIQLVVGWIFGLIYPEPKSVEDLDVVFLRQDIYDYLQLLLLFLAAILIARKIQDLKYWKIALALCGILVLNYHWTYLYYTIDYYWINDVKPQKTDLKSVLTLISFDPAPPRYEPINHLTGWQFVFYGNVNLMGIFRLLLYSSVARALWIAIPAYFFFRKRKKSDNEQRAMENTGTDS